MLFKHNKLITNPTVAKRRQGVQPTAYLPLGGPDMLFKHNDLIKK